MRRSGGWSGSCPSSPICRSCPPAAPARILIGRTAALLVDISFDLTPAGWRLVSRPGIDQRRAEELLDRDLDALTDVADDFTGPFKLQAAGPWTLAAGLERTRGDRAVVDAGARRDLGQSLAEGLAVHAAAVAARMPGAEVVVQLDEPSVPAVLMGGLPTISGFGKLSAVEAQVVEQELAAVVTAMDRPVVVHCCAPRSPLDLFRAAGARRGLLRPGAGARARQHRHRRGGGHAAVPRRGPGTDAPLPAPKATAARVQAWWRALGFPAEELAAAVTLTPSCGLAGASPDYARAAMAHVREAAKYLQPE